MDWADRERVARPREGGDVALGQAGVQALVIPQQIGETPAGVKVVALVRLEGDVGVLLPDLQPQVGERFVRRVVLYTGDTLLSFGRRRYLSVCISTGK